MRSSILRWAISGYLLLTSVVAFGQFELSLGKSKSTATADPKITVTTEPKSPKTGDVLTLKVGINVPKGAYTYSMKEGFSGRTKVDLKMVAGVEPLDKDFTVNQKPKLKDHPATDTPVETFEGDVVWSRRFKVTDAAAFAMSGTLKIQVCDESSCRPLSQKFELGNRSSEEPQASDAKFIATYEPPEKTAEGDRPGPVEWTVKLSPSDAQPGDKVTLEISANVREGFHIFALDQNPKNLGKPTVINPQSMNGVVALSDKDTFKAGRQPELHDADGKEQRIYHNRVSFTRSFKTSKDSAPSKYGIAGLVSYQVCSESNCRSAKFEFAVGAVDPKQPVAATTDTNSTPSATTDSASSDVALTQLLDGLTYVNYGTDAGSSLLMNLLFAFLGGMILNVMPCVLPVIAIKALGFAQQAGENRSRILALNAAYSAGVIVIFFLLASLAAFAGLAWGGLFQKVGFNIAMCVLVFAMGLSLLGVFEIPVPGFVGSAAGSQHKEGLGGAFFSGIFATVLATPCSGPFLGTTLGWSVKQSVPVIYLVWLMIGVGMSFPYLVFGFFPKAIKLLPKPGDWMVRFKQFAGFCLLGTTVYLLAILNERYIVPTVVMLLAVGFGLWMIGNLYDYNSTSQRRWVVRVCSFAMMGAVGWFAFGITTVKLPWQKFHPETLAAALKEGRPVMVDFTADWCATCKVVERTTLNTDATKEMVEKYGIVPLQADWTEEDEVIDTVLKKLHASSIPVLAVFSPARPKEPVILRDAWSKATLLEVLEQAAQSKAAPTPAAPMTDVRESRSSIASR